MNFDRALCLLKSGLRMRRKVWTDDRIYLEIEGDRIYEVHDNGSKRLRRLTLEVADILASDWEMAND